MLFKVARKVIGTAILTVDKITSPTAPERSEHEQAILDQITGNLALYEMRACPYCVKVRREIKRLGLNINRLDVKQNAASMNELVNNGGKFQVPCLLIKNPNNTQWMYESDEIIDYLRTL